MDNYYRDKCPDCGFAARYEEMAYPADSLLSPETILLCSNPVCVNYDTENLGPKKLIEFIDVVQDINRQLNRMVALLPELNRQADQIARMGTVKVETLIKKQEQEGRVAK